MVVTALIEINDLYYRPADLPQDKPDILQGISLSIHHGSMVAIIGENGSGKTTLMKHLNGLLLPTKGGVFIDGMDTRHPENLRRIRSLVGMVFQNPENQIVASTVEEDIAFGLENNNFPTADIRRIVSEQLNMAGLTNQAKRPPHLLSGGQIQKLALAGVLARQPRVILFDEPTSMLDPVTRQQFLKRLCVLRDKGITVIFITQHMEEAAYADKIFVLHDGKLVIEGTPIEIFSQVDQLLKLGLGVPPAYYLAERFRSVGFDIPHAVLTSEGLLASLPEYKGSFSAVNPVESEANGSEIISVDDIYYTYLAHTPLAQPALKGVSLSVNEQQIHGIAGSNGSGKSTLLQHLNGLLHPEKGSVHVAGFALDDPDTVLRDVIRKVGMVFQNPESQFFEVYVGDEIAYGPKQLKMDNLRERVRKSMSQVGLDFTAFKDRRLETLSGGEKRKVALASTLVLDQDILLFDEPTAGMDPRSRVEFLRLFEKLRKAGKTILIATHQLDELAQIAHSISIMKDGKIVHSAPKQNIFFDEKLISQTQLIPPLAVIVSNKLIEKGWPIEGLGTTTSDRLLQAIKKAVV
jgi:energy-coupling factor transport system ATP-binding protein